MEWFGQVGEQVRKVKDQICQGQGQELDNITLIWALKYYSCDHKFVLYSTGREERSVHCSPHTNRFPEINSCGTDNKCYQNH